MNMKVFVILFAAAVLLLFTPQAQAGAIRYAGRQIAKGTTAVTSAAASGGATVAGGVAAAGKTTGGVIAKGAGATAEGTVAVGHGVVAAPGAVAHATKVAGKAIWKALW